MRKSLFSEEQIAFARRQHESGPPPADIVRALGVSEQAFYRWKEKYGGLGVAEPRRPEQLEEENRKLEQSVADLSPDGRH